jgi:hypothetical protein
MLFLFFIYEEELLCFRRSSRSNIFFIHLSFLGFFCFLDFLSFLYRGFFFFLNFSSRGSRSYFSSKNNTSESNSNKSSNE